MGSKWLRRIIFVGIGVCITQQLTGINSIMYYGTRVLEESGMGEEEAVLANIAFGVVAVIGGIIALRNMDRIDRRKTFMIGLTLTTTFHCLVGVASMLLPAGNPARPYVILVLVVGFVLSMQTFLNVAVWVWLAEVFPLHMRGLGIGMAVFFCWVTNGFLGLYFPTLVASIGITGSFFLFAGIGVVALLFVYTQVPETRGRSLEALEEDVSYRADLCRPALSRLSDDDGRSRYRGRAGEELGRFLAGVELFSALDPAQLAAIAAAATVRQFSAGDLVVDAFTAPPTEIYVVLTGEVDLWHDQDQVTKAGDDRFVAGDVFGFSAMLTERPIGPRVVATTSASIAVLPGNLVEPAFYSRSGARFLADYISRTRRRSTSAPMFSTVEDLIASTPLVVGPDTPVAVVARQLADRDMHCAVVDSGDGTYGIVTDSMLGRRVVGDGISGDTPAREVMVHPATTVELSGSSVEALITLLDTRAEYLPVVDRVRQATRRARGT